MSLKVKNSKYEISKLLQRYDIGHLKALQRLNGGSENSNYLLITTQGKFNLTICEDKTFNQIEILTQLLLYLEQRGFVSTCVVQNKLGFYLQKFNKNPVYLKEFLPGQLVKSPDKDLIVEIGTRIASLHKIPPPNYLPGSFPYGIKYFKELTGKSPSHPFIKWLREKSTYLKDHILTDIPKGLVHGDIFGDNLLQKDGKLIAIIDFEEASNYYLLFDIAMAAVGIFADGKKIELKKVKDLIIGYQKIRKLTKLERVQLKLFCIYSAVATAFWRYRQYHIIHPVPNKYTHYELMVWIADSLMELEDQDFIDQIFD